MGTIIICWWIMLLLFGLIIVSKVIPNEEILKISYELKISLWIAILGFVIFAIFFLASITSENSSTPYFMFMCVWLLYIYKGGKTVALKTISGVFSKTTKKPVGIMKAGLNWADPLFEVVTVSVDGIPNKSLDLQELKISIHETPLMQTKTRGIQAKIKHISFMLELEEDKIEELLSIEGGADTVKGRIIEYTGEFFLEEVAKFKPTDLDQDKRKTLEHLTEHLPKHIKVFCDKNNYPYNIVNDSVVVGDTELEEEYYKVLAKKEYAKLEKDADDVKAKALRARLAQFGNKLLPTGTEKDKVDTALVALSIVRKDINEKKYGLDPDAAKLAKDLAAFFKK